MNRTLKEATVKKYHCQNHRQCKEHLHNFLMAYNVAKRLKPLEGVTPMNTFLNACKKSPIILSSIYIITL